MKTKSKNTGRKILLSILIFIFIILLGIIGFIFYQKNKTEKDFNKHLKKADKYIIDLDYDEAIEELRNAIDIAPKNEEAYLKLADVYIAKAEHLMEDYDYAGAIECYDEAIKVLEDGADYIKTKKRKEYVDEIEALKDEAKSAMEIYERELEEAKRDPNDTEGALYIEPDNEPNTSVYEVLGAASLANGDIIVLTPPNFFCSGAVWCDEQIDSSKPFTVELDICADEGSLGDVPEDFVNGKTTGADGFVINFASEIAVGNAGTEMGYCGQAGVELDTYPFGSGDPEEQHIALIEGATYNHVASTMYGTINDDNWHRVKINYNNGKFEVFFDGELVLKGESMLEGNIYVGVTAATGSAYNRHMIRYLKITVD